MDKKIDVTKVRALIGAAIDERLTLANGSVHVKTSLRAGALRQFAGMLHHL